MRGMSQEASGPSSSSLKAASIAAKWRKLAEARCEAAGERLTPARLAAYAELVASGQPLIARDQVLKQDPPGEAVDDQMVDDNQQSGRGAGAERAG